jgi:hypothetical protein
MEDQDRRESVIGIHWSFDRVQGIAVGNLGGRLRCPSWRCSLPHGAYRALPTPKFRSGKFGSLGSARVLAFANF